MILVYILKIWIAKGGQDWRCGWHKENARMKRKCEFFFIHPILQGQVGFRWPSKTVVEDAGCRACKWPLVSSAVMLACSTGATNIAGMDIRLETNGEAANRSVVDLLFVMFCSVGNGSLINRVWGTTYHVSSLVWRRNCFKLLRKRNYNSSFNRDDDARW